MKISNTSRQSSESLFVRVRPMAFGVSTGSVAHPELLPSAVRSKGITLPIAGYVPAWGIAMPAVPQLSGTTQPKATAAADNRGDVAPTAGSVPRGRPV